MHSIKEKLLAEASSVYGKTLNLDNSIIGDVRSAPSHHPKNTLVTIYNKPVKDADVYAYNFGYDRVDLDKVNLTEIELRAKQAGGWVWDSDIFPVILNKLNLPNMYLEEWVNTQLPIKSGETFYLQATGANWVFHGIKAVKVKYV